MNIEFDYKIFAYCIHCLAVLDNLNDNCNSCANIPSVTNSELILFPIEKELNHIIRMNSDFIKGYRPHGGGDLIYGKLFFLWRSLIVFNSLGDIYKSKPGSQCVTLILSTDGKPTTINNRSSMWPVRLLISRPFYIGIIYFLYLRF